MKVLFVYPNQTYVGHKPVGIATLSAVLKKNGIDTKLFDTTEFDVGATDDTKIGEELMEFKKLKNPERLPRRKRASLEELITRFFDTVEKYNPDLVAFSVLTDYYPLARILAMKLKKAYQITTIFGGIHVTIDPESVIKEEFADIVCIGEAEEALLELCEAIRDGKDISGIRNIWVKENGKIIKNDVRPLIQDLDSLPFPDWEIFGEIQFYKPYMGWVYRYGDFELSRGCPYRCSYCVNDHLQKLYSRKGKFVRGKSVARAIEEIKFLKNKYDLEFIKFWDETFLLMTNEVFDELVERYRNEIGLPFVIETTAQSITEERAKKLKEMGCASVSIGMETGNECIRKKILNKDTPNETYVQAFALLNKYGIRTAAFNMLGLPFETKENIIETIRTNAKIVSKGQTAHIFYPYKGTALRELCIKEGFLNESEIEKMELQFTPEILTRRKSVLKMPQLSEGDLMWYRDNFILYVETPEWLWPAIDMCRGDKILADKLIPLLRRGIYNKRFES